MRRKRSAYTARLKRGILRSLRRRFFRRRRR